MGIYISKHTSIVVGILHRPYYNHLFRTWQRLERLISPWRWGDLRGVYEMAIGRFLAGVGALIWDNSRERYLIVRRSESKDFAPGAWECVTGRVDQGEGFEAAVHREVKEELGIKVYPKYILGTTHFYRGEAVPENELVGVVFYCETDGEIGVKLSAEHSEYKWVRAEEAYALLSKGDSPTEHWLGRVIRRAEWFNTAVPREALKKLSQEGFELDS